MKIELDELKEFHEKFAPSSITAYEILLKIVKRICQEIIEKESHKHWTAYHFPKPEDRPTASKKK